MAVSIEVALTAVVAIRIIEVKGIHIHTLLAQKRRKPPSHTALVGVGKSNQGAVANHQKLVNDDQTRSRARQKRLRDG